MEANCGSSVTVRLILKGVKTALNKRTKQQNKKQSKKKNRKPNFIFIAYFLFLFLATPDFPPLFVQRNS